MFVPLVRLLTRRPTGLFEGTNETRQRLEVGWPEPLWGELLDADPGADLIEDPLDLARLHRLALIGVEIRLADRIGRSRPPGLAMVVTAPPCPVAQFVEGVGRELLAGGGRPLGEVELVHDATCDLIDGHHLVEQERDDRFVARTVPLVRSDAGAL